MYLLLINLALRQGSGRRHSGVSHCSVKIRLWEDLVSSLMMFHCDSGTTKPVNWRRPVYELDLDPENNGFINEDFIVWMRTAALPTFRKLYRIIQKKSNMVPTLPRGNYTLEVVYSILHMKSLRYSANTVTDCLVFAVKHNIYVY